MGSVFRKYRSSQRLHTTTYREEWLVYTPYDSQSEGVASADTVARNQRRGRGGFALKSCSTASESHHRPVTVLEGGARSNGLHHLHVPGSALIPLTVSCTHTVGGVLRSGADELKIQRWVRLLTTLCNCRVGPGRSSPTRLSSRRKTSTTSWVEIYVACTARAGRVDGHSMIHMPPFGLFQTCWYKLARIEPSQRGSKPQGLT